MHRHKPDFILLVTIFCLVAFGLVMVYSASMVVAIQEVGAAPSYYFVRQLEAAGAGLILMLVLMNIPYTRLYKWAKPLTIFMIVTLLLVLVPHIGSKERGVRRWIGPPALHFQPSQIALLLVLIYLAYVFDKQRRHVHNFKRGVFPALVMLALLFTLILAEPDMGTGMLLLASGLTVMFAAGVRRRHMVTVGLAALPFIAIFALIESYRSARILEFLDGGAYQLQQSLIAIHHGGLFGQGLGRGLSPFLYLPVPQADFIFTVVVEELGLIGAAFLLGLFGLLIWRGIRIAQRLDNRFASLLAVGISAMIGYGVIINVAAVTGLIPITGIPLPFVSYGGIALIVSLCGMGILLSLSRCTVEPARELPVGSASADNRVASIAGMTSGWAPDKSRRRPLRRTGQRQARTGASAQRE